MGHDSTLLIHDVVTLSDTSDDNAIRAWWLAFSEPAAVTEDRVLLQINRVRGIALPAKDDLFDVAKVFRVPNYDTL